MKLKITFSFIYVLISIVLFASFDATISVWISFFISGLVLFFITGYHIFVEKEYSPFLSSFIVFSFLFFQVAPIVQINSFVSVSKQFMTYYPYNENEAIFTNLMICVFNIVFFISYVFFKKLKLFKKKPKVSETSSKLLPATILSIAIVCVLIFFVSMNFVLEEVARPTWMKTDTSTVAVLLWKKVLFLVPFGGVLLCFQYFKKDKKKAVNWVTIIGLLLFFLLMLLWFKNPLTEKRNALGPIYICLIFLFIPRFLNSNVKTLFFLFFSMIILFPLTAIVTHSDATFKEIVKEPSILLEQMKGGGIANAFNTLNYDAFANIMATQDYVGKYGYANGEQFLSAFLFFIPRSIWEDKPISTGELVGKHLINDYEFRFSNLSNPLVSEGYINFGFIGIILVAIGLAIAILKLMTWLKTDHYLKKMMAFYFAIHLIFLLRGDFANGFSYYIGTIIGVILVPKIVEYILRFIVTYQETWKKSKIVREVN